jgi:ribokinase
LEDYSEQIYAEATLSEAPLLVVVGSANLDLTFRVSEFPSPGETIAAHGFLQNPGGKGANQAVAAARLGAHVEFVGRVGKDSFGLLVNTHLASQGVGVRYLMEDRFAPTGLASIMVSESGENTIVVHPGANERLGKEDLESILNELQPQKILTQFEIPAPAVRSCFRHSPTIVNPSPIRQIPMDDYAQIDTLALNRGEARSLSGIDRSDGAACIVQAKFFLDRGVQTVIVTLGSEGAFFATNLFSSYLPAPSVKVVDTTGAGDTFLGAYATFILEGREPIHSVMLANAAAALSTTGQGAQCSMPSRDELLKFAPELF